MGPGMQRIQRPVGVRSEIAENYSAAREFVWKAVSKGIDCGQRIDYRSRGREKD